MGRKAKRFVWVLSLTVGPVVYCILLLALPDRPSIEAVRLNLIELVTAIVIYWLVGFGLVWAMYWLSKFLLKYGPFL
ncbi:MAG TPA: hypothetical protein VMX13_13460 [Sedimentisphaerales bacterium]|nr:hypothetical protein [Sedimentisphaerales bacterium]